MALFGGQQLANTLVQNAGKVAGAFGLGIVAVVAGGLMLSDVHRIPQASPASAPFASSIPKSPGSVTEPAAGPGGPTQIAQNVTAADSNDPQLPQEDTGSRTGRRRRGANRKAVNLPDETADAHSKLLSAPPVIAASIEPQATLPQAARIASSTPPVADLTLRLPAETPISVRLSQEISSKKNRTGEVFRGTLAEPLKAKGLAVAEAGAPVLGRIVESKNARIFRGGSNLNLELTDIELTQGRLVKVKTTQWYETGDHSKVVKAAMLPSEAAKKLASGMKPEQTGAPDTAERTVAAEPAETGDKGEKRKGAVTLTSGSEIVFRLLQPVTVSADPDHH